MRRALLLLLLLSVSAAPAWAVIDPFYRNRMESGYRAFERGSWDEAAHQLRIACFGHLEEPVALVEGLIRLAVAEAMLGDEDAFQRSVSRLVDLEERFSAYSSARIPDPVRRQFETQAARLLAPEHLPSGPAFRGIAELAEIQRLTALAPDRRRAELEARLAAEPENVEWLLGMARLELSVERPRVALDWLDRLPAEAAARPPATCLRQQAASESAACERMDLSQPFCQNVPAKVVEGRLKCLVEAARWDEAAAVLAGLSPELLGRRRIARLERRVRSNTEAAAPEPADAPLPDGEAAGADSGPPGAEPATTEAPPPPGKVETAPASPPTEERQVEQLRRRIAASASGDELVALRREVETLADRHPRSRPARLLAAEIAYLLSDWPAAVAHFRQAGELRPDEARLAFYKAVALYESGNATAAAEVLRPVAPRLERNSFVEAYLERILAPGI